MMYCKCGNEIPEVRVKLGYKTCVKCSKEDKWGCSHLIFHKTGNTIEIIKDKELCEQINMMAERPAFGVSRGVKGNIRKPNKEPKIHREKRRLVKLSFEEVGEQTMDIIENEGYEKALEFLEICVQKDYINGYQYNKIKKVIQALNETLLS